MFARSAPGRRRATLGVAALTVAASLTGCSSSDDFVRVKDGQFSLGSEPFRFVGFNIYDAASTDLYSCRPDTAMTQDQLAATLKSLHDRSGMKVLRFWAYQPYTAGGRDFSGIDKVVAAARAADMRVIPVLEDGPGDCTTSPGRTPKLKYRGDTYFTDGYRTRYGSATLSLRDYAARVAAHYRDEPTIMAWMIMNEAETNARDDQGRTVLVNFAKDMGKVIHDADPNHLVTLGTQSNSAPGGSGRDFTDIYSQPEMDFSEVHDWRDPASPMPGLSDPSIMPSPSDSWCQSTSAPIACSFALAPTLKKPLLVGETGITATDAASRQVRADQLDAKMARALEVGAGGYLVWQANSANTDGYGVIPGQNDPLLPRMKQRADHL